MKQAIPLRTLVFTATLALFPVLAHAHPGHSHAGFAAGAAHPVSGLDHILAMFAVGLWAVQLGRRALWAVPASFVAMMTVGGALGMAGISLPFVEQGILVSVLLLGLLVATATRIPVAASMLLVSVFALFHGHAHGVEMPVSAAGFSYSAGFVVATALLHGSGILAGLMAARFAKENWLRAAGGSIVACGCALMLGWI
jgi:urease accessory protein